MNDILKRCWYKANYRQKKWNAGQSLKAYLFDFDFSYLQHLHETQNGKCFYSGIKMSMIQRTHWQLSLERINPNVGYCRENIALIALEFNTQKQWTNEKVLQIPKLINQQSTILHSEDFLSKKAKKLRNGAQNKKKATESEYFCYTCSAWKAHREFSLTRVTRCRRCHTQKIVEYERNTIRGFLLKKYKNARSNSKKKNREFNLTINDMFDMLQNQKFRCYYSGIPMSMTADGDWQWSPERINNERGYCRDNCVLICEEFQSTDYSGSERKQMPKRGSPQWNKTKFQQFLDHIQHLPAKIEPKTR